ncbi:rna-directed dna polymerase [Cystoisospora suis]|uniref:Telomerase reverse transcriptase n=1 Tax=Cystoisospora suis TaxID=483139 RepID=A0A2C6LCC1_9APIC|nr:rna-directed dna polymerase [Cystoisospora suis]
MLPVGGERGPADTGFSCRRRTRLLLVVTGVKVLCNRDRTMTWNLDSTQAEGSLPGRNVKRNSEICFSDFRYVSSPSASWKLVPYFRLLLERQKRHHCPARLPTRLLEQTRRREPNRTHDPEGMSSGSSARSSSRVSRRMLPPSAVASVPVTVASRSPTPFLHSSPPGSPSMPSTSMCSPATSSSPPVLLSSSLPFSRLPCGPPCTRLLLEESSLRSPSLSTNGRPLRTLSFETPPARVVAFVLACLRRIVPGELLGGARNLRLFLTRAKQFVQHNARESPSLHMLMHEMKRRPYTSLFLKLSKSGSRGDGSPGRTEGVCVPKVCSKEKILLGRGDRKPEGRPGGRGRSGKKKPKSGAGACSPRRSWKAAGRVSLVKKQVAHVERSRGILQPKTTSNSGQAEEVFLAKIVYWLFTQLVIPLLRQHFYITEAEPTAHRLRYFRKISWLHVEQQANDSLRRACFSSARVPEAVSFKESSEECIPESTSLIQDSDTGDHSSLHFQCARRTREQSYASPALLAENTKLRPVRDTCATNPQELPGGICDSRDAETLLEKTLQLNANNVSEAVLTAKAPKRPEPRSLSGYQGRTRATIESAPGDTSEEKRGASALLVDGAPAMKRSLVLREHGEATRSECPRGSFQQRNETTDRTVLLLVGDSCRSRPTRGAKNVTANRGRMPSLSEVTEGTTDELGSQRENTVTGDSEPKASEAQGPPTYSEESALDSGQTLCPVPAVRLLPKLLGCRPLVNLSQPHSGVLLAYLLRSVLERDSSTTAAKDVEEARRRQSELLILKDAGAFQLLAERQFPSPLENPKAPGGQTVGNVEQANPLVSEYTRDATQDNTNGACDLSRKVRLLARAIIRAEQNESCRALRPSLQEPPVFCRSSPSYPSLPRLFRTLPAPFALHTFRRYVQRRISAASAGRPSPAPRLLQHSREKPDIRRLARRLSLDIRLPVGIDEAGRTDQLSRRETGGDSERCGARIKASSGGALTSLVHPGRHLTRSSLLSLSCIPQLRCPRCRMPPSSLLSCASVSSLSLNGFLTPVRSALAALCRSNPAVLGCSVLSFADVHRHLLAWWKKQLRLIGQVRKILSRHGLRAGVARVTVPRMFFVVGDLQACYEGISHAGLLDAMQRRLEETGVETLHVMKVYKRVVSPSIRLDENCKRMCLSRDRYQPREATFQQGGGRKGEQYRLTSGYQWHGRRIRDTAQTVERSEEAFASVDRSDANAFPPAKRHEKMLFHDDGPCTTATEEKSACAVQRAGRKKKRKRSSRPADEVSEQSEREVEKRRRRARTDSGTQPSNTVHNQSGCSPVCSSPDVSSATMFAREHFFIPSIGCQGAATTGQIEAIAVPSLQGRHPLLGTFLQRHGKQRKRGSLCAQGLEICACHLDEERKDTHLLPQGACARECSSASLECDHARADDFTCAHMESTAVDFSPALVRTWHPPSVPRSAPRAAEAVFRGRLLRGCAPGGAVMVTEVGQPMVLCAREILLVVKLFLSQHRVRFSSRAGHAPDDPRHPSATSQRPDRKLDKGKAAAGVTGGEHRRKDKAISYQSGQDLTKGDPAGQQTAMHGQDVACQATLVVRRSLEPSQFGAPRGHDIAQDYTDISSPHHHGGRNITKRRLFGPPVPSPTVTDLALRSAAASSTPQTDSAWTGRQGVGIPQGSSISGFLCALYYADKDAQPEIQALLRGESPPGLDASRTEHRAVPEGLRMLEDRAGDTVRGISRCSRRSGIRKPRQREGICFSRLTSQKTVLPPNYSSISAAGLSRGKSFASAKSEEESRKQRGSDPESEGEASPAHTKTPWERLAAPVAREKQSVLASHRIQAVAVAEEAKEGEKGEKDVESRMLSCGLQTVSAPTSDAGRKVVLDLTGGAAVSLTPLQERDAPESTDVEPPAAPPKSEEEERADGRQIQAPRVNPRNGQTCVVCSSASDGVEAPDNSQPFCWTPSFRALLQNTQLWPRQNERQAACSSASKHDQVMSGTARDEQRVESFAAPIQNIFNLKRVMGQETFAAQRTKRSAKRTVFVGPLAIEFGTPQLHKDCGNAGPGSFNSKEEERRRHEKILRVTEHQENNRNGVPRESGTETPQGEDFCKNRGRGNPPKPSCCSARCTDRASLTSFAGVSQWASFARARRARHRLLRALKRLVWPPLLVRWVDDFLFLSPSRDSAEAFLKLLLRHRVWGENVNERKLKSNLFFQATESPQQARDSLLTLSSAALSGSFENSDSPEGYPEVLQRSGSTERWRSESPCCDVATPSDALRGGAAERGWPTVFHKEHPITISGQCRERRKQKLGQRASNLGLEGVREKSSRKRRVRIPEKQNPDSTSPAVCPRSRAGVSSAVIPGHFESARPMRSASAVASAASISSSACLPDPHADRSCSSGLLPRAHPRRVPDSSFDLPSASSRLSSFPVDLCHHIVSSSELGPCWAGVRISFDLQNRGLCILPLLRRDVPDEVNESERTQSSRKRKARFTAKQVTRCAKGCTLMHSNPIKLTQKATYNKKRGKKLAPADVFESPERENLGEPQGRRKSESTGKAITIIRDSLSLRHNLLRGGRTSAANRACFMKELLEQRLFGHLRMRLGTTRLFVDLRLNTVEAVCRNVYVVAKTVFLKLRCGLERITREFAGFVRSAYIIGVCTRLISVVLTLARQPLPISRIKHLSASAGLLHCRSSASSRPVMSLRLAAEHLAASVFRQRLRFICYNAAASAFRPFKIKSSRCSSPCVMPSKMSIRKEAEILRLPLRVRNLKGRGSDFRRFGSSSRGVQTAKSRAASINTTLSNVVASASATAPASQSGDGDLLVAPANPSHPVGSPSPSSVTAVQNESNSPCPSHHFDLQRMCVAQTKWFPQSREGPSWRKESDLEYGEGAVCGAMSSPSQRGPQTFSGRAAKPGPAKDPVSETRRLHKLARPGVPVEPDVPSRRDPPASVNRKKETSELPWRPCGTRQYRQQPEAGGDGEKAPRKLSTGAAYKENTKLSCTRKQRKARRKALAFGQCFSFFSDKARLWALAKWLKNRRHRLQRPAAPPAIGRTELLDKNASSLPPQGSSVLPACRLSSLSSSPAVLAAVSSTGSPGYGSYFPSSSGLWSLPSSSPTYRSLSLHVPAAPPAVLHPFRTRLSHRCLLPTGHLAEALWALECAQRVEREEGAEGRGWPALMRTRKSER